MAKVKTPAKTQQHEELYNNYIKLQSKEFMQDFKKWEPLEIEGKSLAIKVNFTWGWLRVYRTPRGIEWY